MELAVTSEPSFSFCRVSCSITSAWAGFCSNQVIVLSRP